LVSLVQNVCFPTPAFRVIVASDCLQASSVITDDRGSAAAINPSGAPDYSHGISNAPRKKASKHKFNILGRKTSLKDEDNQPGEVKNSAGQKFKSSKSMDRTKQHREMLGERGPRGSGLRNRSADRQGHQDDAQGLISSANGHHASLQQNIRNTGTRAADGFGRAAKGLLGKLSTRTGLGDLREAERTSRNAARDEAEAQRAAITKSYKVVNLPLDEQTRKTRICKRLEDCKDKTEFWLPAVAYRCIDYLNDKGMTHEGLYRVPGSEREIRNWIWRFDNGMVIFPAIADLG
jgi:RhoGAP domain